MVIYIPWFTTGYYTCQVVVWNFHEFPSTASCSQPNLTEIIIKETIMFPSILLASISTFQLPKPKTSRKKSSFPNRFGSGRYYYAYAYVTGPEGGLNGTLSPAVEIFVPTVALVWKVGSSGPPPRGEHTSIERSLPNNMRLGEQGIHDIHACSWYELTVGMFSSPSPTTTKKDTKSINPSIQN